MFIATSIKVEKHSILNKVSINIFSLSLFSPLTLYLSMFKYLYKVFAFEPGFIWTGGLWLTRVGQCAPRVESGLTRVDPGGLGLRQCEPR